MISTTEQEDFMHLIYDVIHNGIAISNIEWKLSILKLKYNNLNDILNTRMKNEKYSDLYDLPIMKVIFETQTHIMSVSNDEFIKRKLDAIKLLQKYGAHLNILNEKYMNNNIDWKFYLDNDISFKIIYDYIKNESNKIIIKI
jgi:hypothetical protein